MADEVGLAHLFRPVRNERGMRGTGHGVLVDGVGQAEHAADEVAVFLAAGSRRRHDDAPLGIDLGDEVAGRMHGPDLLHVVRHEHGVAGLDAVQDPDAQSLFPICADLLGLAHPARRVHHLQVAFVAHEQVAAHGGEMHLVQFRFQEMLYDVGGAHGRVAAEIDLPAGGEPAQVVVPGALVHEERGLGKVVFDGDVLHQFRVDGRVQHAHAGLVATKQFIGKSVDDVVFHDVLLTIPLRRGPFYYTLSAVRVARLFLLVLQLFTR